MLERAYREHFVAGMFDMSSSSPEALTARDVLDEARAVSASLLDRALEYEPGGGSLPLREAVASRYNHTSSDQVLITAGASEAIRVATEVAIQRGDRVVVQRPVYQALFAAALSRDAHIVNWTPTHGYQFDFSEL